MHSSQETVRKDIPTNFSLIHHNRYTSPYMETLQCKVSLVWFWQIGFSYTYECVLYPYQTLYLRVGLRRFCSRIYLLCYAALLQKYLLCSTIIPIMLELCSLIRFLRCTHPFAVVRASWLPFSRTSVRRFVRSDLVLPH